MSNARTLLQEVYFDLCDVIYGNTYQELGYDNRRDFLLAQRDKLAQLENILFPVSEEVSNDLS